MHTLPIQIAFAGPQTMLYQSLCVYLKGRPEFDVLWMVDGIGNALSCIAENEPDVVLVDTERLEGDAFELSRRVAADGRQTKVILLTSCTYDAFIDRALKRNVAGYLLKDETLEVMVESIQRVANGELSYSPHIQKRLRFDPASNRYELATPGSSTGLTERQILVLKHLAEGASAKEVAQKLHVSTKAVSSHTYRIMQKLNIHDRVQLARFAIREGLTHA